MRVKGHGKSGSKVTVKVGQRSQYQCYQERGVAVAADRLVQGGQAVLRPEVDVRPPLHHHPDGLAPPRLTLHRQGQGGLCGGHTHTHTQTHTTRVQGSAGLR